MNAPQDPRNFQDVLQEFERKVKSDRRRRAPLLISADEDVPRVVMEHLLKHGANANIQDKHGRGALTYISLVSAEEIQAGHFGRPLPVQQLQKAYMLLNSSLDMTHMKNAHFLHRAIFFKNGKKLNECNQKELMSLIKTFIEDKKVDVNQHNYGDCESPLHSAVEAGNLQIVAYLIKHNAKVNQSDKYGSTPLHYILLVQGNSKTADIVEQLVKAGADTNAVNNRGVTASVHVLRKLTVENLRSLANCLDLTKIVNDTKFLPRPNLHCFMQDTMRESSITSLVQHTSKENDLVSKLNVLYNAQCNFDLSDIHHRNLLHWACWLKCPRVLGYLVQCAVKNRRIIKDRDSLGRNCFHFAASLTIVKLLEKKYCWESEDLCKALFKELSNCMKEDIDCQDYCGRTALHHAVSDNNGPGVKELLKYGASVSIADDQGQSPIDYACQLGHFDHLETMAEISEIQSPMYMGDPKTLAHDVQTLPSVINPQEVDGWIQRASITYGKRDDLIKRLMNDPLTKPVLKSESESRIINEMLLLAEKISKRMAEIDPLYSSTIQLAGSVSEGTKIGTVNEFDIQFNFLLFGSESFITDSGEEDHRVTLIRTVGKTENIKSEFYLQEAGEINLRMFSQRFICLAMEAVSTDDVFEGSNFQLRYHRELNVLNSFVEPLCLIWGGPGCACVPINVDLVPIIRVEKVAKNIRDQIPVKVQQYLDNTGWATIMSSSKHRVTFHDTEVYIMRSLVPELREAYMMTKAIIKLCPDIHRMGRAEDLSSYMLKNALFQELDPNFTYSLLERQVCLWKKPKMSWVCNLPSFVRVQREVFIRYWAMKIFAKLERMVESERYTCYCQPSMEIESVEKWLDGNECNVLVHFCKMGKSLLSD